MRQDILGVGFDPVTKEQAVARALDAMERDSGAYVCTPNPEIVMCARRDPAVMEAINGAELVLPDGVGILWAAGKLQKPMPERVAGYDFLMALLAEMQGGVFILGGRPDAAQRAAHRIEEDFPNVTVSGWQDGYYTDEAAVLEKIRAARPALLMVCLGAPRQELWMARHRDSGAALMAGLGGSVDVLAGTVRRAPLSWRRLGLEWLYRLLHDPRRIKRQICLPLFVLAVLAQRTKSWKRESSSS